MKKISIVTFVPVGRGFSGPSDEAASLAEYLHGINALCKIYCPSHKVRTTSIPEKYFSSLLNKAFLKVLDLGISYLRHLYCFNERRVREEFFDYLVSCSLKRTNAAASVLLFLKPGFPMTAAVAHGRGIKNIGYSPILHPRFNLEQVRKEEARFSVKSTSSYVDPRRVENLTRFFNTIDYLLVESEMVSDTFVKCGVPEIKIHVLKNVIGVDCERFSPRRGIRDNETFTVLHLSHMSLIKGVGYLFEAWNALEHIHGRLVLGGRTSKTVLTVFDKISPSNTVFLGALQDTPEWYNKADVFVSPSVADKGPYTILEAMACKVPVIASNMCGWSSIIENGKDGFVYQYDDVEALRKHILWCSKNRNKLKEMGEHARKKALRFRQEDFAQRIVNKIMRIVF